MNMNLFSPLIAAGYGEGHMQGWGGGWTWLWGTLMMFSWVLIIGFAVVFISRSQTSSRKPSEARAILDERYARGELTTDEYRERQEQIQ